MSTNFYKESDDVMIAKLNERFNNFMDRYENDRESSKEWRKEVTDLLKAHDDFLSDLMPLYKRALLIVGIVVTGSIALAVKIFWSHIRWNG